MLSERLSGGWEVRNSLLERYILTSGHEETQREVKKQWRSLSTVRIQQLASDQFINKLFLKASEARHNSLWTSSSWALFFKETKSLVLAATALNLPRPPAVGRLGFWGAAWARRWSRYWARSSASEEDQEVGGEKSRDEVCRVTILEIVPERKLWLIPNFYCNPF